MVSLVAHIIGIKIILFGEQMLHRGETLSCGNLPKNRLMASGLVSREDWHSLLKPFSLPMLPWRAQMMVMIFSM